MTDFLRTLPGETPVLQTFDTTTPQPTLRIRVEHSRTQRDGWGYSTTVEMDDIEASNPVRVAEAISRLSRTLEAARLVGELERDVRNQRDAILKSAGQAASATPASPETHS